MCSGCSEDINPLPIMPERKEGLTVEEVDMKAE